MLRKLASEIDEQSQSTSVSLAMCFFFSPADQPAWLRQNDGSPRTIPLNHHDPQQTFCQETLARREELAEAPFSAFLLLDAVCCERLGMDISGWVFVLSMCVENRHEMQNMEQL